MLETSNLNNTCYIETSSLDGERNLKRREGATNIKGFKIDPQNKSVDEVRIYGVEC